MALTRRVPGLLASQKARNWPSFINDRDWGLFGAKPHIPNLYCQYLLPLPTSQAVQAHRQSLTNSACAQACPTGLLRTHTP